MSRFLIPALLLVTMLIGSVASVTVFPSIPPPPYVPRTPAEDIIKVEAWLTPVSGTEYGLSLFVYMKSGTPGGHTLNILVTQLTGNPETEIPIMYYQFSGPTTTDALVLGGQISTVGTPEIALYAWVDSPGTDREPNTGFYPITALSQTAPNIFIGVEPAPVGGVVVPTSKLEIVAPFLALAGLAAVVSAVVVVKRRRH